MVRCVDEMGNFGVLFVFISFLLLMECGNSKEISKRSIMQRVFNRGPGESLASVFLGHKPNFESIDHSWGSFRVLPQFDENFNFHRQQERHRFDFRHQPLNIVTEPIRETSESFVSANTESPVTSGEIYQGFNNLPHYIRNQNFLSFIPEQTAAIFTSKPEFAGFLPQFDKTNSFNSEPATFTSSVNEGIASESPIIRTDIQPATFLPQFDKVNTFNSQPATITSSENTEITSDSTLLQPTMEMGSKESPVYQGFKLLPSFDNWNNFRVASPIIEPEFQQASKINSMETMPKNENSENVHYNGFRILPNFDGITSFRAGFDLVEASPEEEPTIQEIKPVSSMESMPLKENSETVHYTGFRVLPNFDGITNFKSNLNLIEVSPVEEPIIQKVKPVINSMESMPQNEHNEVGSPAYTGFRLLPSYDGINNFRKDFINLNPSLVKVDVPETFDMPIQNVGASEKNDGKDIHYTGFKLLPNFGSSTGFLDQNLFKNPHIQQRFDVDVTPVKSNNNFNSIPSFDHNQLSPIENVPLTNFHSTPAPSTTPAPIPVTQHYNGFKFLPGFDNIHDFNAPTSSQIKTSEPHHNSIKSKVPEIRQQFHTLDVKVEPFTPRIEQTNLFRKTDRNGMKVLVKVRKLNKVPSSAPNDASSVPPKIFPVDQSITSSTVLCQDIAQDNNNLQFELGCKQRIGKKLPISVSSVADLPLDPHAIFDGDRLPNKNSFGETVDPDRF